MIWALEKVTGFFKTWQCLDIYVRCLEQWNMIKRNVVITGGSEGYLLNTGSCTITELTDLDWFNALTTAQVEGFGQSDGENGSGFSLFVEMIWWYDDMMIGIVHVIVISKCYIWSFDFIIVMFQLFYSMVWCLHLYNINMHIFENIICVCVCFYFQ